MPVPERLKGYPVREISYRGAGSYYVLVERPDHPYHKWVVATWVGGNHWYHGHYFETYDEARKEFDVRC